MNLLAYIQGKRKGKEAHCIEREAMRDPFLADALDGFDTVKGDHAERIAGIRMKLFASVRKSNRKIVYISIAASLLLCVSIGGYFLMNKDERSLVAQSDISATEEDRVDEVLPETDAEKNKQVNDRSERLDEQTPDNFEARRERLSEASPPLIVQDESIAIADHAVTVEEEVMKSEIAAAEVSQPKEDSSMIAQKADARQPSRLVTPSGAAGQRAMTSTASVMPEPKIGMKAYKKYLKDSMVRPEAGECAKKKGEVIVEFKINAEGRPHGIVLRKKLCGDLDKEAIRLIENGSVWVGDTNKAVILEVKF